MNELQEKKFDYSLVDEETAKELKELKIEHQQEKNHFAFITGKVIKRGKELLKENTNYGKDMFQNWCQKEIGCNTAQGYRFIRYYEAIKNNPGISNDLEKLSIDVVASLESNRTPEEVKEKIKSGEIDTQKEMTELRKKIKQERKQKEKLQEQVEKLKDEKEEIKAKKRIEVEKEVIPDDYEDVKEKAEQLEKAYNFMEEQKNELEERFERTKKEKQETEEEVKEFQNLQKQVKRLRKRKDDIGKQVDSAANLSEWTINIKEVLQDNLAPMKYSEDIANQAHDSIVMDNVMEVVELVEDWCNDMRNMINETQNTINVEVINND